MEQPSCSDSFLQFDYLQSGITERKYIIKIIFLVSPIFLNAIAIVLRLIFSRKAN